MARQRVQRVAVGQAGTTQNDRPEDEESSDNEVRRENSRRASKETSHLSRGSRDHYRSLAPPICPIILIRQSRPCETPEKPVDDGVCDKEESRAHAQMGTVRRLRFMIGCYAFCRNKLA